MAQHSFSNQAKCDHCGLPLEAYVAGTADQSCPLVNEVSPHKLAGVMLPALEPYYAGAIMGPKIKITSVDGESIRKALALGAADFLKSMREAGSGIARLDPPKPKPIDYTGWVSDFDLLPDADD